MSERTVLIVEDESDAAEMFAEMVRIFGLHAVTSLNSPNALALVARLQPSLLILDIMLPEVSGLDLLRSLRVDPRFATLPVILVSALALPIDVKAGLAAGANAYLPKPVAYIELKNTMERLLAIR